MIIVRFFVFCVVLLISDAKNENYKGSRIYKIHLQNEDQYKNIYLLKSDLVDFLKRPSWNNGIDGLALVPPSHFIWFEEKLNELGLKRDVHVEDVYEYLTIKDKKTEASYQNEDNTFNYNQFHRYDVILDHIRAYQENYNSSTSHNVELVKFGETAQGRDLVYLKVISGSGTEDKPVIVIEGGINPREWITIPASLNIADKLFEEEIFLSEFDWIIIPVLNPDGYEYTHTNLRFWEKSMSTNTNFGAICPGVNINRNFDIDWQVSDSSSSPCSHLFAGPEAGSEIETQLVLSLLEDYGERIRMYISLQNNGGVISYPWNYEFAASGMFRQHHLLGLDMVAAMEEEYKLGVSSVEIDRISGTSSDYFRQADVLYSFNIDIVDRGDSFLIPENDIGDIIEDVWRAVAVAARSIV